MLRDGDCLPVPVRQVVTTDTVKRTAQAKGVLPVIAGGVEVDVHPILAHLEVYVGSGW